MSSYQIGRQTGCARLSDGLLCRLRLLFTTDDGHERDMDMHKVVAPSSSSQLSHGFNEGCTLNITHSSTKFNNADVRLLFRVVHGYSRDSFYPILDGICDMRHDLDGLSQVVSASLAFDDMLVHLPCCDAILEGQGDVQVALVVAQVEIDFAAIVEYEAFSVPVFVSLDSLW